MNLKHILEGWRNDLIPPENLKDVIKEVSNERLDICRECPMYSENRKKDPNFSTLRTDIHCTNCGCPLKKKTKSLASKCPLDKWQAYVTSEEQEKLKEYEKD